MQSNAEKQQHKQIQECKAVSVVRADKAPQLLQLLEGLSGQPGLRLLAHVLWLKGPIIDKLSPKIRLTRVLAQAAEGDAPLARDEGGGWTVRQEGLPTRSRGVADLPAVVRSITNVHCNGSDIPRFWHSMGFVTSHEGLQEGHIFSLTLNSVRLNVLLVKLFRLPIQNKWSSKTEVQPGELFLEVTAVVVDEQHVPACQAIGSLGEQFKHICELQKP